MVPEDAAEGGAEVERDRRRNHRGMVEEPEAVETVPLTARIPSGFPSDSRKRLSKTYSRMVRLVVPKNDLKKQTAVTKVGEQWAKKEAEYSQLRRRR